MGLLELRPRYTSLPRLRADIGARAAQIVTAGGDADGLGKNLYRRGTSGVKNRIARFEYSSDLGQVVPVTRVKYKNVTPSEWGLLEAAPSTGLTRELKAGHNVTKTSGVMTLVKVADGTRYVTAHPFTRSGTTLTFLTDPAAGGTAENDLAHVDRLCELGEPGVGGLWVPVGGAFVFDGIGLVSIGNGYVLKKFFGTGLSDTFEATVKGRVNIVESSAGADSHIAVGLAANSDASHVAEGLANNAGTWKAAAPLGSLATPSFGYGAASGAPGTKSGVLLKGALSADATPTNGVRYTDVLHAALTQNLGNAGNSALTTYGLGSAGSMSSALFKVVLKNGGSLAATLTEMFLDMGSF